VATAPEAVFVPTPEDNANLVSYTDWVRGQELINQESVSLTATTPLKNQFLGTAVGDTELDEEGAGTVTPAAKATITLAGDTDSGFAIFNNSVQYYAGLLSGTDLGAPLMDDGVSLTWMGAFRAIGIYIDEESSRPRETGSFSRTTSFELEITFGADSRGVAGSVGSIEAFQQIARDEADNRYYLIEGTFDAGGYITGTVNLGAFTNGDRTTTRASNGVLTGIIGKNGAVGTFISNPIDTSVTTGEHAFAYAGGFAVAPPPPLPSYNTFVEHYGAQLPEGNDQTTTGGGGFLRGLPNSLNTGGLTLDSDSSRNIVVRLGEVASGHADYGSGFGVLRASNRYRAGLLSGTDLGALLTPDVTASWSGKAYAIRRGGTGSGDLTLTVNFDAGTINSTTAAVLTSNAGSLTVRGRFGSKWGLPDSILGGSVSYGTFNNVPLIGLIGAKGVLGVFHAGSDQQSAGGFWAKPTEETATYTFATEAATYSDWTAALTETNGARKTRRASGVDISTLGGFGSNDYITLNGSTIELTGANVASGTLTQDSLMLDGSAVGGVVFGVHDYDAQSFVGLLPTTNVGGAITAGPAKATWRGSLKGLSNSGYTEISSANFELEVTFNAGTKQGTIKTFNDFGSGQPTSITGGTFNVDGEFDMNGVMWGNVALNNSTFANGVFSGLIGQNGAVGAFIGANSDSGYAGGFVVKPPSN
ncbi:MAG: hypothetical protein K8953_07395, partial [Proteobacteria bacterium]|nr:hypothetical protein [Pseudomonadota bacterium]